MVSHWLSSAMIPPNEAPQRTLGGSSMSLSDKTMTEY